MIHLELEHSLDLHSWEAVPVTPEMISEGGSLQLEVDSDAGSGFFRLRINIDADPTTMDMVLVEGGTLAMSMGTRTVDTFEIGRFQVTWGEWKNVREWAVENGYDLEGVGAGCGDDHPVHTVNWYDVLKWSNAKSEMQGLTTVYTLAGLPYRTGETIPAQNLSADGYRLPLDVEWEFAARGGTQSQDYHYAGSNNLDEVGWYFMNSGEAECDFWGGRGTWPVGQKAPNELGLHDMSGNVSEWCWDNYLSDRILRGGNWNDPDFRCLVSFFVPNAPDRRVYLNGFRLARTPSP